MKLKLRLEDLEVEAFLTTSAPDERGTVWGQQCTCDPGVATCDEGLSCWATCPASCVTCDYFNPTCYPDNCNTFDRNPPCM